MQIYEYSPGVVKVREKMPSVSSAGDAKVPPLPPIRCGLSSSFFHVTVVPTVTVRAGGKYFEVFDIDGGRTCGGCGSLDCGLARWDLSQTGKRQ